MADAAINTLVQRLEAVTARLEAVESQLKAGGGAAPAAGGAPAAAGGAPASGAAWVSVYEAIVADHVKPLVALTQKFGNDNLKKQVAAFEKAVDEQRNFINIASVAAKPNDADLGKLLEPTAKLVQEVIALRDKNRGDALWNHLSAISEAVPALGWVSISPTPGPFVNEFKGNSEFYSNKLLVQYKGKDEDQVSWCTNLKEFFVKLIAFIKQYHTTGLVWKANGEPAAKFIGAAPPAAAPAAPGPPPPGPPPPAAPTGAPAKAGPDMNALFSSLNQGVGISSGLKKVTSDMKTKNRKPEEKVAVVKDLPKKTTTTGGRAAVKKGTPKVALEGNKWVVEFQDDNQNITISDTEPKHAVYLYKNDRSVVNITGQKINSICIDSCNKTGIVFNSAIAVVEVVNCNGVEIQCQGSVPAFAIDKSSSIQVILSKDCLGAEIVTSKSDQVNVQIPDGNDLVELAVPEQYKTTVVNGKLVTTCVEHV